MPGFWEISSSTGSELIVQGWVFSNRGAEIHKMYLTDSVNSVFAICYEKIDREDVVDKFIDANLRCGFKVSFDCFGLSKIDISQSVLVGETDDGEKVRVGPNLRDRAWECLSFKTSDDFSRLIQNPAFRHPDPCVQALGAMIARLRLNSDKITRVSALVVLLYKIIFQHVSTDLIADECTSKALDEYWAYEVVNPLDYRWKVSLGTAVGYFLLIRGRLTDAMDVFMSVAELAENLILWPAMATNIFTACLIVGLLVCVLNSEQGAAIDLLKKIPGFLSDSLGQAPLKNYYQYEEHINAIRVAAHCASLLAKLDHVPDWVGPDIISVDNLSHIPPVVRKLLKSFVTDFF